MTSRLRCTRVFGLAAVWTLAAWLAAARAPAAQDDPASLVRAY